jgi:uncharacterized protein (DUF1499 family)
VTGAAEYRCLMPNPMIHSLALVVLMAASALPNSSPILPLCPASPNCVSSQAEDNHRIEPFNVTGDARAAFVKLREILARRTDTTLITSGDTMIMVEFRTMLGFVDDGLFVLDAANCLIQVRSAARLGYWDMGKNRRRMEEIRKTYLAE